MIKNDDCYMEENKQEKPHVQSLHYSEEFLKKSSDQIMEESIAWQKKCRVYQDEYSRQVQEGKDPFHKTVEQVLQDAEMRLHGATKTGEREMSDV